MPSQIVPADQVLPTRLRLMPLRSRPIFPGVFTPMMVTSPEELAIVEEALSGDRMVGMLMTKDEEAEDLDASSFAHIGTICKIVKRINLPDGGVNIFVSTIRRFLVRKILTDATPFYAAVDYPDPTNEDGPEVQAMLRSLVTEMKQLSENNPLFSEEMRVNMINIDQPGKVADFIASILNIGREDQQAILEDLDIRSRMEQVLIHIKKEQELLRIQKRIQKQINEKIEKSQREYFLREELKAIKQELGMPADAKSGEYLRLKEAVDQLVLEPETRKQVDSELEKFQLLEPNSPEYGITRNYLETIVSLPWRDPDPEEIDLGAAREILDADHYGLEDVKERILEFLAVRKLKRDSKGSIVCLVGPPGVGKTSVGKSIARALGKPFFRFSVGGMRDEAEIKGHRRTYIGAMPGKIIQGLKVVGNKAPVFMIDEIDKMGASFQGDPSSALLEVLDREQNSAFRDHYLDLPFDISHIFFIATANTLDTIPAPLHDRMEIIRLSGYIDQEKLEIAKTYLIPKSLSENGLTKSRVTITKRALSGIAERYAREAGVRNFEKAINRIHRKVAAQVVAKTEAEGDRSRARVKVDGDDLDAYLGPPRFDEGERKTVTGPGMVIGLAWTAYGGETLMIEAVANEGKSGITLTGQMGEVMQESATIAFTFTRHIAAEFGIDKDYFENHHLHVHIPAGATPKDGPSAGITMATALISLVRGRAIKKGIAMTGELSLSGTVLPIGGLKEKVIAARRQKIRRIIIPKANERDIEEIPEHVRRGVSFHPVASMREVVELVF